MDQEKILQSTFDKIDNYINCRVDNQEPVVKYKKPGELSDIMNVKIADTAVTENEFLTLIDRYLDLSVVTGNKQFFNQLYSGFNFPAVIGEILTTLTNTSMATYEIAPVATIIEEEMIRLMSSYVGYENGDGIFVSGGSNANLVAMLSARNHVFPKGRFNGYDKELKLKAFVNEHAHYSFDIAANVTGIGSDSIIKVKADENGKMIPEELEKEIKNCLNKGETPFFVAATFATTVTGSYDPVNEIAEICRKYDIWLHGDGSLGGSLLLSEQYRYMMRGVEKTDSFAWNPHKLMNIPLVCSMILVKNRGKLQKNLTDLSTDYLYHNIDNNIEDLGKKSLQCGRRVDAVKLWFAMKYYGIRGYQQRIENSVKMAEYAEAIVKDHPGLELLVDRQSFTVCFRYVPETETDLNKFNLDMREYLRKSGKAIVNYGYIGETLAIRLVTANGELRKSDIDLFFESFLSVAKKYDRVYETTN